MKIGDFTNYIDFCKSKGEEGKTQAALFIHAVINYDTTDIVNWLDKIWDSAYPGKKFYTTHVQPVPILWDRLKQSSVKVVATYTYTLE